MEDNSYILVCDSAYGTYYIGRGSQEEMNQMQKDIDKYSTGTLKVIKYDGDDLADLIENTVEFNKKFKGLDGVTDKEETPEKELETETLELDTSKIELVPENVDVDPFAETEKLDLQMDDTDPFADNTENNKEDINQAELDKLREEADDGDEDLFDDEG